MILLKYFLNIYMVFIFLRQILYGVEIISSQMF